MTLEKMKEIDYEAGLCHEITHYLIYLCDEKTTFKDIKEKLDAIFSKEIQSRCTDIINENKLKKKE